MCYNMVVSCGQPRHEMLHVESANAIFSWADEVPSQEDQTSFVYKCIVNVKFVFIFDLEFCNEIKVLKK